MIKIRNFTRKWPSVRRHKVSDSCWGEEGGFRNSSLYKGQPCACVNCCPIDGLCPAGEHGCYDCDGPVEEKCECLFDPCHQCRYDIEDYSDCLHNHEPDSERICWTPPGWHHEGDELIRDLEDG